LTVTVFPETAEVSQFEPLSTVATAPMVVPLGTPAIWKDCESGAAPPAACVNVRLDWLAVAVDATTVRVTAIVCAGTFAVLLDTIIDPV
jgi:hypothetical protein